MALAPPTQIGLIILENEGIANITKTAAPTLYGLAQKYLNFTNYNGTSNPSLPDYCAMSSGSWLGKVGTDSATNGFAGTHSNIMHATALSGRIWKTYEEDVLSVSYGYTGWGSTSGSYASRHCPGAFYTNTNAKPVAGQNTNGRFDFRNGTSTSYPGLINDMNAKSLPDLFIITPNLNNDGHNPSTLTFADKWLSGANPNGDSPAFPGINTLIGAMRPDGVLLITFDNKGGTSSSSVIYACIVGQNVAQGSIGAFHSHFTMLYGIQQSWGIAKFTDSDEASAYAQLSPGQELPWPKTGSGDTTAPTAPTTISATALSSSSIKVTWAGATDNVAVTGYQVFRGGVQIASPAASPFTDVGPLQPSTLYSYTVKAVDAAGNVSPASAAATATTLAASADTTPPSQPQNLTATGTSSSTIALQWSASTDNVGVTGYQVYRIS